MLVEERPVGADEPGSLRSVPSVVADAIRLGNKHLAYDMDWLGYSPYDMLWALSIGRIWWNTIHLSQATCAQF